MILFVDETENEDFFIVTGLLIQSRECAKLAHSRFKNSIASFPLSQRKRALIFTEFKATLLDKDYKRIKYKLLEEINRIEPCIIYSCYIKKGVLFSQRNKEEAYIVLLSKIISSIDVDVSVVFDTFNKPDFEASIIDRISSYQNVQAIMSRDSQQEPGLQFVDNVCSVIRHNISGTDENKYYDIIKKWVKEV